MKISVILHLKFIKNTFIDIVGTGFCLPFKNERQIILAIISSYIN
jgi:hypothetical protein